MSRLSRPCLGLLAVLAAALAPLPALAAKRALVVSIDNYIDPQARLQGAVNDGRNIQKLLTGTLGFAPDQVKMLLDRDATRAGILGTFQSWLVNGTGPGDEVFFYYSGHGLQVPDVSGDEQDGLDEALAPADVKVGPSGFVNVILDDEIEALLDRLRDRQVTMMIDSCHSGTISRGAFGAPEGSRSYPLAGITLPPPPTTRAVQEHRQGKAFLESKPGRVVWSAVAPYQLALEERQGKPVGGVFTNRFVRGLAEKMADRNGDGVVTYAELHDYVLRESDAYCRRAGCPAGLTPMLEAPRALLPKGVAGPVPLTPAAASPAPVSPAPPPQPVQTAASALLGTDNPGNVAIRILPGPDVRLGQTVRFEITSGVDGALVVFDVNAAGQLVQIFPNSFSDRTNKSGRIAAGRPLTIPDPTYGFEFTASEPAGQGQLIALVLQDPVDLGALLTRNRALQPVPAPVDHMADLAARLRRPWTQDTTTRPIRWSMTATTYRITR